MKNIQVMNFITLYLAWQRDTKRFIAFLCNFLGTMKTSNDLTACIDGFKDDISANNTSPICQEWFSALCVQQAE